MDLAKSTTSKASAADPAAFFDAFFGWQPKFDMPKFDFPKMQGAEAFREIAEKNIAQTKDAYDKVMAATENATAILQKSCTTAANAAATLNLKIIQASHTNSDAAWDFAQKLFTVKSLAEFTALSTAHVRKQCEVWSEQAKEFSALTQELTIETVEPVKNGVTKMLKAA